MAAQGSFSSDWLARWVARSLRGMVSEGEVGLRRILLFLVMLGLIGLLVELALLEHTDSWQQILPFGVLGLGLITALALVIRTTHANLRAFQAAMLLSLAAGVLGLVLHFQGNIAFERELEPDSGGALLVWHALRGATPALAPGAMIQIGLLGLVLTYRHPAARRGTPALPSKETSQ